MSEAEVQRECQDSAFRRCTGAHVAISSYWSGHTFLPGSLVLRDSALQQKPVFCGSFRIEISGPAGWGHFEQKASSGSCTAPLANVQAVPGPGPSADPLLSVHQRGSVSRTMGRIWGILLAFHSVPVSSGPVIGLDLSCYNLCKDVYSSGLIFHVIQCIM